LIKRRTPALLWEGLLTAHVTKPKALYIEPPPTGLHEVKAPRRKFPHLAIVALLDHPQGRTDQRLAKGDHTATIEARNPAGAPPPWAHATTKDRGRPVATMRPFSVVAAIRGCPRWGLHLLLIVLSLVPSQLALGSSSQHPFGKLCPWRHRPAAAPPPGSGEALSAVYQTTNG
jgi:hypothetical protein